MNNSNPTTGKNQTTETFPTTGTESMCKIIPHQNSASNNYFSPSASTLPSLPVFYQKLLKVYYDDRLAGHEMSNRSLDELARRFGKTSKYISVCLRQLEEWGYLQSHAHGSGFKRRWITYEAFIELDNKNTNQNTNQILPIPYISLPDHDLRLIKDSKGAQNCGQLSQDGMPAPIHSDADIEQTLNVILEAVQVPFQERSTLKQAIFRSQLPLESKLGMLSRFARVSNRSSITHKRAYFLKAIQNEENRYGTYS